MRKRERVERETERHTQRETERVRRQAVGKEHAHTSGTQGRAYGGSTAHKEEHTEAARVQSTYHLHL